MHPTLTVRRLKSCTKKKLRGCKLRKKRSSGSLRRNSTKSSGLRTAPPEYADREMLWNAVEKVERGKKAQLAYSFDIALQNEFSMQENIDLTRQFLLNNFVNRGMLADFAVHQSDKEDGGISNPHFHVMCPIRPIEPDSSWGNKQLREAKEKIVALIDWLKEVKAELAKPQPPMLNDLLALHCSIRNKSAYSNKSKNANLPRYAEAFNFLQSKNLYTVDNLETTLHSMQDKIDALKKSASTKQARCGQAEIHPI